MRDEGGDGCGFGLDPALASVPVGDLIAMPDEPGELCLGGPGVAPGYLDRPELSEERFVPGPFAPDRLYKTGDLVRLLETGERGFLLERGLSERQAEERRLAARP